MDMTARLRPAGPSDYDAVVGLLSAAGLPIEGLSPTLSHAVVAVQPDGVIAGCVAVESYGKAALLRSLAIAPSFRGQGLGQRLAVEALRLAAAAGAREVYLLTETAAEFFPRLGFAARDRASAPALVQQSIEFRSACPSSAVLMHLGLPA